MAADLLNKEVLSIETIGGGRNSQVYKLTDANFQLYALKVYFQHTSDKRDRLGTEFSSFQFLWQNGVNNIPQPLMSDQKLGCALYEYIAGQKIDADRITKAEIDTAVTFLTTLKELKNQEGSNNLAKASEACFSIKAIVENIQRRLQPFSDRSRQEEPYVQLYEFLDNQLLPEFENVVHWAKEFSAQSHIPFDLDITLAARTLSPSDFGWHNAIRRHNGQMIFLDFEYFGWDDPAKMVVDMLLHPAMNLSDTLKQRYVAGILGNFVDYPTLAKRVELVYPLFGLKWCLILLNEFLPTQLKRRQFAGLDDRDRTTVQLQQLTKSKQMLQTICKEYKQFPYFG